ncbi:MAG TPA: hypothetical protein VJ695_01900, partial [Nitrososphaera sp.]|nr:hypothetical protein [Nitrososphaera sp.]
LYIMSNQLDMSRKPSSSSSSSRVDRRGTTTRGYRTNVARRTKSNARRSKRIDGNRSKRGGTKATILVAVQAVRKYSLRGQE